LSKRTHLSASKERLHLNG